MAYTDNTILTKGKYKFTKLCRVPPQYLIGLFNNGDKSDPELYEYVKQNSIEILLRLNGKIKPPRLNVCQKFYFSSEEEAKKEIKRIAKLSQKNEKPKRAYECEKCSGWHLTSSGIKEFNKKVEYFKNK